ncbi:MAG: hypothetical protein K0S08_2239 [Gammaproteobacteria bacterium]|jgi:hypothetical protein|nr:hypothetical protein [Gammaproteobacteria bacterium]
MRNIDISGSTKLFFSRMLELYRKESYEREVNQYRVIEIIPDAAEIQFQVIGTGVLLKVSADKLMRSDLLLGFSKKDIAVITHMGTKVENKDESYKKRGILSRIIRQIFSDKKSKFIVEDIEKKELIEKTAYDLYTDKTTPDKFSSADTLMIGYSAAEDHYRRVFEETSPKIEFILLEINDEKITFCHQSTGIAQTKSVEIIFNSPEIINKFNANDRSLISYSAAESRYKRILKDTSQKPKFKLLNVEPTTMDTEWCYECIETGVIQKKHISFLFYNTELLSQFNSQDRNLIAFTAGELSKQRQYELKSKERTNV